MRGEARRDHDRDARFAAPEHSVDVFVARDVSDDRVEAGGLEPANEVARRRAAVVVEDHRSDVSDVGVDRITEEQELEDGQGQHHREREPITAELMELLPGDDE
jgi:hypothetical protein